MTRRAARFLGTLLGSAVLLTGCAGDTAPADEVPLLAERLAGVDQAVSVGDEAQIREQVEALVDATEVARDSGQLDDEQADRVLAAADALLAQLPAEEPPAEPAPSTTTSPPPPEQPVPPADGEGDDEGKDGKGKGRSDEEKKPEEAEKKAEEEQKKDEEEKEEEEKDDD